MIRQVSRNLIRLREASGACLPAWGFLCAYPSKLRQLRDMILTERVRKRINHMNVQMDKLFDTRNYTNKQAWLILVSVCFLGPILLARANFEKIDVHREGEKLHAESVAIRAASRRLQQENRVPFDPDRAYRDNRTMCSTA